MFLADIWHLSYVCLSVRPSIRTSVRPSVVNTIASEYKEQQTWKLHIDFYYLYAGWYWKRAISVHSIWYLPYGTWHMERPIQTKFDM